MNSAVPTKIRDILKKLVNGNLENYTITVHDPNKKGEGYMGEMCYVSLKDKHKENIMHFVIKQAFTDKTLREVQPMRRYYLNEIHFYTKVWPCFQKLQREMFLAKPFDSTPKCFITSSEDEREIIVLENLKYQHFETFDKKQAFDEEHVKFILKEYGKFHALSFAYKLKNPQEFIEITKDLENFYVEEGKKQSFADHVKYVYGIALKSLDPQKHAKVIEKFQPQAGNIADNFSDISNYQGDYGVVLHGDCWSNNMMFKYNESRQLIEMKLFDFQVSKLGTPVVDLSYFLYSGAPKEVLDNLEHYLRLYHNSLVETLKGFRLNASNIYPFEVLKSEWKKYFKTGFIMGLVLWRGKLTYDDSVKDYTDMKENDNVFKETKFDEDACNKRLGDLILHVYENDFL